MEMRHKLANQIRKATVAMSTKNIEQAYQLAKEQFAELGVNTDAALKKLASIPISLHCWQGDDVGGFEKKIGRAHV